MKQSFMQGTLTLFVSGIVNRVLGFIPRILLPRFIGAEGVGLFQLTYPFLILLLTVISGGLPTAIAKLVAEEEQLGNELEIKRIVRISFWCVCAISLVCAIVCVLCAQWMSVQLFRDERVYPAFIATIPMLFIVGISSVLRGYYQGRHNMIPTAVSQLIETIVRLFAVIFMAKLFLPYGLAWAAAGAMLGVVLGEFGGLLYLIFYKWKTSRTIKYAQLPIDGTHFAQRSATTASLRKLMKLATPMTANKLVASTSYFFESVLIIQSLALAGISAQQGTAMYGILQGMIIPILVLPNALTYSLSLALIPAISQAYARQDLQQIRLRLQQSLKLCVVSGIPFAVVMFVFAEPICELMYHNTDIAYMLKWMAPVALFLYVQGPLQATLQALDSSTAALRNTLIAAVVKLTLIYMLASSPQLGITGALIAININIVLTALLHWLSVRKRTGLRARALQLPLLCLCAGLMTLLALTAEHIALGMQGIGHSLAAVALALSCYICFLFAFRIISISQLKKWIGRIG